MEKSETRQDDECKRIDYIREKRDYRVQEIYTRGFTDNQSGLEEKGRAALMGTMV
ncbi:MAG: hypothetical protein ACMUIL_12875 [bacterium]